MTLPLLAPLLLEAVLGASAHVPLPVALMAAAAIGVCLAVFAVRERRHRRHPRLGRHA